MINLQLSFFMPGTAAEHMDVFLRFLQFEKRYSRHTIIAYQADLQDFFSYLDRQYSENRPDQVTHHQVRSWMAGLREQGTGARTLRRKLSSLQSFFKYQLRLGHINQNPLSRVVVPKAGSPLPQFAREEEMDRLLQLLSGHTNDWKGLNARLLITVFYATGMRLSELIQLRDSQVDAGRRQVRVLGKGKKERILPLAPAVLEAIQAYQAEKKRLFEAPADTLLVTEKGRPLYPRYAWALVNQYLGETSSLAKRSPHVLRHSFATHLMNNGADLNAVKELLGHSSLAATQVYTHTTIGKLKDIHARSHPRS